MEMSKSRCSSMRCRSSARHVAPAVSNRLRNNRLYSRTTPKRVAWRCRPRPAAGTTTMRCRSIARSRESRRIQNRPRSNSWSSGTTCRTAARAEARAGLRSERPTKTARHSRVPPGRQHPRGSRPLPSSRTGAGSVSSPRAPLSQRTQAAVEARAQRRHEGYSRKSADAHRRRPDGSIPAAPDVGGP